MTGPCRDCADRCPRRRRGGSDTATAAGIRVTTPGHPVLGGVPGDPPGSSRIAANIGTVASVARNTTDTFPEGFEEATLTRPEDVTRRGFRPGWSAESDAGRPRAAGRRHETPHRQPESADIPIDDAAVPESPTYGAAHFSSSSTRAGGSAGTTRARGPVSGRRITVSTLRNASEAEPLPVANSPAAQPMTATPCWYDHIPHRDDVGRDGRLLDSDLLPEVARWPMTGRAGRGASTRTGTGETPRYYHWPASQHARLPPHHRLRTRPFLRLRDGLPAGGRKPHNR
ncbi:hypothetical protein GCM10025331_83370 [Actinoplanes utahensis]|nr:hypothetical protein Aut01nite_84710 [Actinoplanes utahensis]